MKLLTVLSKMFETVISYLEVCISFLVKTSIKQILPVVIKGNWAQIGISMQRSVIWQSIQILKLTQNMTQA